MNNITKTQLSLLVSPRIFSICDLKKWIGTALMQSLDMKCGITDWDIRRVAGRPMRIDIEGIGSLSNPVQLVQDR